MGNAIARRQGRIRMMKLDGQVVKVKAPATVDDILRDYPGHVIFQSEAVSNLGVRAKPLHGSANLKPKRLYFLVQMPKVEDHERAPRRVRSGIIMNAESRLESMLLARRSVSDICGINSSCNYGASSSEGGEDNGARRIKMRVTKAQLAEMMAEGEHSYQTAVKIMESCLQYAKVLEHKENEVGDQSKRGTAVESKKAKGNRVRFLSPQHGEGF